MAAAHASDVNTRAVRVIGIDLAWREGTADRRANETGVIAADVSGAVLDAGWTCGVDETLAWIERVAGADALLAVDAPLIVTNPAGQRLCERQVGQRYGRWKVSANSTNLKSRRLAGVGLLRMLELADWVYHDGCNGPPDSGRHVAEVYPYTTLVGAAELRYDDERPVYKRRPPGVRVADFRPRRAAVCDDLVQRLVALGAADPPLDLGSHPVTRRLTKELSPLDDRSYKHREDLIDAVLCAWTGLLWMRHGLQRCQVLGSTDIGRPRATIIAPARPAQRRYESVV
jgi:predicted RNase H-like nuclease